MRQRLAEPRAVEQGRTKMLHPRVIAAIALLVHVPAATSQEILRSRLVAPAEPLAYLDHAREGIRLYDAQK